MSRVLTLFFAILVFSGCEERSILDELSQRQANEVISILYSNGISATINKVGTGTKARYSINVSSKDYQGALSVVQRNSLPSQDKLTVDEIIKEESFFPQTKELELLKLERAYASEIEKFIRTYSKVYDTSAVVRLIPNNQALDSSSNNSSVAIVVESEESTSALLEDITAVVMKIVPNITKGNIFVTFQPIKSKVSIDSNSTTGDLSKFLGVASVQNSDHRKLSFVIAVLLLMFCVAGGIIGYYVGLVQKQKNNINPNRVGHDKNELLSINNNLL